MLGKIINLTRDPSDGDAAIKMVQTALTGKTIGVQASTTHANFANKYLKDVARVKEYKTTDARDLDLKSGRIDAVLDAYPTIAAAADKPDAKGLRDRRPRVGWRRVRGRRWLGHPQVGRRPSLKVQRGA